MTFASARAALFADDAETARIAFARLLEESPDDLDIKLHEAWARARLGEELDEAIEDLALRALTTGKSLGLPLCILGHAALRRGELHVARSLFRRACEAAPSLVDAARGKRLAEERLRRHRQTMLRSHLSFLVVVTSMVSFILLGARP